MRVSKCSITETFYSQLPRGSNITSIAFLCFSSELVYFERCRNSSLILKCAWQNFKGLDLSWLQSWNVGRVHSNVNNSLVEYSKYILTRVSLHALQTLINYSLCEAHAHYGLNYIAEETEVQEISKPSICRGWLPTGPKISELKALSTHKYLPARLLIKSTTDLETNQEP